MIWSSEASLIIFLIFQVKKKSLLGYIFFLFQFKMKTKTEAYKFSLKKQLCFPLYYLKTLLEQKGLKPLYRRQKVLLLYQRVRPQTKRCKRLQESSKQNKRVSQQQYSNLSSKKGVCTRQKREEAIHLTLKRGTAPACAKRRITDLIIQRT